MPTTRRNPHPPDRSKKSPSEQQADIDRRYAKAGKKAAKEAKAYRSPHALPRNTSRGK